MLGPTEHKHRHINLILLSQMLFRFNMSVAMRAQLVTPKQQLCMCNLVQIRGVQGLHNLVKISIFFVQYGKFYFDTVESDEVQNDYVCYFDSTDGFTNMATRHTQFS